MSSPYEDILPMPHHISSTRQRMSMTDRAAQFSPFAALTGHDAAIRETARLTDAQAILAVDSISMLDEQIRTLAEHQKEQPEITAEYFVPDERKDGGAYVRISGRVKKVDANGQMIVLTDGRRLGFDRILSFDTNF